MELARIVDPDHALVRLGRAVDRARFEEAFGKTYCENNGRPAVSVRLMVALHFLKYTLDLSDEAVMIFLYGYRYQSILLSNLCTGG